MPPQDSMIPRTLLTARRLTQDFAATDKTVGAARAAVAETLKEWELPHLVGDAKIIVSELATNVYLHTDVPMYTLKLVDLFRTVSIGVWDRSEKIPPIDKNPALLAEAGRGWRIIHDLSIRCGMTRDYLYGGKLAWAHLLKEPDSEEVN